MVAEEIVGNLTNTIPELLEPIGALVTILQIIGGIIGIYVLFWVISSFINARRLKLLERMHNELKDVNKNLRTLIKVTKSKR